VSFDAFGMTLLLSSGKGEPNPDALGVRAATTPKTPVDRLLAG
jgi:hypothetical protein